MELLPHRPVAPRGPVATLRVPRVQLVQQVDVLVGGHRPQHLRRPFGALRVHVAPPEDGLHAPELAEAPVVAQHRPQLRVDPSLDHVVRAGQRPLRRELGVEVREERPLRHERGEGRPGLPYPLVRVDQPALRERPLLEEVRPEGAPLHVPLGLPAGLREVLQGHELQRQAVQLPARLELRAARRVPLHLAERVEEAPLHLGFGPLGGACPREAASPVGDDHVGRRDAG